jgi:hypothetical protein
MATGYDLENNNTLPISNSMQVPVTSVSGNTKYYVPGLHGHYSGSGVPSYNKALQAQQSHPLYPIAKVWQDIYNFVDPLIPKDVKDGTDAVLDWGKKVWDDLDESAREEIFENVFYEIFFGGN